MARGKSVTMKDVAREANVALGTVSKVINGIPVGEKYRIRVENAVEKLGYRINHYAKGLRCEKTGIIAVMIPNLTNPFFAKLADHLCTELALRDQRMLLCTTDYDPTLEQARLRMAEQQMVDGIICCSYSPKLRVPADIPMVSIDRFFGAGVPCVASDNYSGGMLAAQKLAQNGCKNVAFFRVGSDLTNETNKRQDGFLHACDDLKLPCQCVSVGEDTPYTVFERFLQKNIRSGRMTVDGIFCVTDDLACKVVSTLTQMGYRVPEDVQVIGFDGLRRLGDGALYCSTIVQPVGDIARTCVNLLMSRPLPDTPYLICLPVQYAAGGTTRQ